MPKYVLHYFAEPGRGQIVRYLFAVANVDFEDRIIDSADWPVVKKNFPQETVPVLEVDDAVIIQSGAISRYLAREFDLYGKSNWDATRIDEIVETVVDLTVEICKFSYEKDEKRKEDLIKKFKDTTVPKYLDFIEKYLNKNKERGEFLVGEKVSVADVYHLVNLHDYTAAFVKYSPNLDHHPGVKKHYEKLKSLPQLSKLLKDWKI